MKEVLDEFSGVIEVEDARILLIEGKRNAFFTSHNKLRDLFCIDFFDQL
jgi:hypothetical protein